MLTRSNGATDLLLGRINLRTESGGRYPPNARLPKNTIPRHYEVQLISVLEPDFLIDGAFTLYAEVKYFDNFIIIFGQSFSIITLIRCQKMG